jgi:murein DD-endopeptidase MepM/ murein hydrolase activator NlpD
MRLDFINPAVEWDGRIWSGGHFYSGRNPSSPIYKAGVNGRPHLGIDLAAPLGSPLVAPADAIVNIIDYNSGAGNWIGLRYPDTVSAGAMLCDRHLHIKGGSIRVRVGQTVRQGDRLADIGSTGASAGPHDHWELLWGITQDPTGAFHIDPEWHLLGVTPANRHGGPPMIEALQEQLTDLGYDPGPIDGIFGSRTAAAWALERADSHTAGGDHTHNLTVSIPPVTVATGGPNS